MATQLAVLSEWHIILALIIVFLLFGGKKLPELARGIGEAMKEFKKASRDIQDDTPPATSKPAGPPATSGAPKTDESHNKSA
jgi:sec-independent protein translocase protein TatA